jgi:hypothetical protein
VYKNVVRLHCSGDNELLIIVTTKNDKIYDIYIELSGITDNCRILDNGLIEIDKGGFAKSYACVNVYEYYTFTRIYKVNNTFKTKQYSEVVQYVRKMMPNILLEPLMQIVLDYFIVNAI